MDWVIKALVTWRISHMLVNEMGPFSVLQSVRSAIDMQLWKRGKTQMLNPLNCIYCTSVWVGWFVGKGWSWGLALSALAIFIEQYWDWAERQANGKS